MAKGTIKDRDMDAEFEKFLNEVLKYFFCFLILYCLDPTLIWLFFKSSILRWRRDISTYVSFHSHS